MLIILNFYNAAITMVEIMQGNSIRRKTSPDMILYSNIIIQFVFRCGNKRPFPFHIQVASLAIASTNYGRTIIFLCGFYDKPGMIENNIIYFNIFFDDGARLSCKLCQSMI